VNQAGIEFYEQTHLHEHIQDMGYLSHSPLGNINSEKKKLLIGTGLDFPQAFQSLCRGLLQAEVPIDPIENWQRPLGAVRKCQSAIMPFKFYGPQVTLLSTYACSNLHRKFFFH
jgi:hypothetical protein